MKSNASDYLELAQSIYIDACAKCVADVFDLRDLQTMRSRIKYEGLSFLTITLPEFCKDFEQALQIGHIDSTLFLRFRKRGKSGSIPSFLRGLTSLIFDEKTGRIFNDQDTNWNSDCSVIVDSIRQICLSFKKIELPCASKRVDTALRGFIEVEQSLRTFSLPISETEYFSSVSDVLWGLELANISISSLNPRHGPGSTAERITGNSKFRWRRWHDRLEPFFPFIDNAYSISAVDTSIEYREVTIILPEQEQPVRVVTVPKTLKGPRIIAIEPCCMQYAQQAIREALYATLESAKKSAGHVNFRDQEQNQQLALTSSLTGQFATIDLSDASDRVPLSLALAMFSSNPDLRDAIEACRSVSAKMPGGEVITPLNKFASMGSALCFPVESMYFYTICVAALLRFHNLPVSHSNVFDVSRGVYVYGDDIIVPSALATTVLDYLQKYNCKVNKSKTFVTGMFRESCGLDAYHGESVTPVYIGTKRPENRQQGPELISWVSTANSFYKKGYWRTAQLMFIACERILGPLPYVSEIGEGLGRVSVLGYRSVERWNRKYQRFEMKCWVPRPVYRSDSIDGYSALVKCLTVLHRPAYQDWDAEVRDIHHLKRSALHGAVVLKRRWVPSLV